MAVSFLLGILVGAVLGLTGAGGGILAVPALVVGLGWSMQQAAPVALIAVAGSAAIGAVDGFRKRLVRYRAAIWMAAAGAPFVSLGNTFARTLSQRWLMSLFAAVMLMVAFRLFRQAASQEEDDSAMAGLGQLNAKTGRFDWSLSTALLIGVIGAMTGLMTGLLGVGGGFVIVPMLRRFTNVPMHSVVATSLLVIALVGAGGVITAVAHGAILPLWICIFFAFATACGMVIGRRLSNYLSAQRVQQGFAAVLIAVALGLFIKTIASNA